MSDLPRNLIRKYKKISWKKIVKLSDTFMRMYCFFGQCDRLNITPNTSLPLLIELKHHLCLYNLPAGWSAS